jgi:hypothetical protein
MKYARFGIMIATSTVVMLGLMYLNTYRLDHVFFSETRTYMALVMGATMAVIMLAFMLSMYTAGRQSRSGQRAVWTFLRRRATTPTTPRPASISA